jgi:hypothetical protein
MYMYLDGPNSISRKLQIIFLEIYVNLETFNILSKFLVNTILPQSLINLQQYFVDLIDTSIEKCFCHFKKNVSKQ